MDDQDRSGGFEDGRADYLADRAGGIPMSNREIGLMMREMAGWPPLPMLREVRPNEPLGRFVDFALSIEWLDPDADARREAVEHSLRQGRVWCIEQGDTLIGMVAAGVTGDDEEVRGVELPAGALYIFALCVKEGRRGNGFGRRLVKGACAGWAGDVVLYCMPHRASFWRELGFETMSGDVMIRRAQGTCR
jgi:ribosomal protein S18 acetylase RimI-like enzyme